MAGQWSDGSWHGLDQRPPLEYSAFSETAYAIRALQMYAPPGRRAEMQRRVRLAAEWLVAANASHTEEKVMRLLGLVWADSSSRQTKELRVRLLAEQLPDGGWAQRAGFPSDAYATGQALYALHAAAVPPSNAAWQRGIRYLLKTQHDDGSWFVRSRSVKFQPYFDSGFPYGHEQWISAAGTAWAAMSLALASPDPKPGPAVR
jgi:squalene cyclase